MAHIAAPPVTMFGGQKNRTMTSPPEKTVPRRLGESVQRALWTRLWRVSEG